MASQFNLISAVQQIVSSTTVQYSLSFLADVTLICVYMCAIMLVSLVEWLSCFKLCCTNTDYLKTLAYKISKQVAYMDLIWTSFHNCNAYHVNGLFKE